jgi:hypothetical protein
MGAAKQRNAPRKGDLSLRISHILGNRYKVNILENCYKQPCCDRFFHSFFVTPQVPRLRGTNAQILVKFGAKNSRKSAENMCAF